MAEVGLVGVVEVGEWAVMVGVEHDEVAVVRVEVEHGAAAVMVAHAGAEVVAELVEVEHDVEEEAGLMAGEHGVEAAGVEWVAQAVVVVVGLEGAAGVERVAQAVVEVVVLEGVAVALDRKGLVAALDRKGLEERRCWVEGRRGRGSRGLEGLG